MGDFDPKMADYLRFHGPRFDYLVRLLAKYLKPGMRVLDVGRSRLTDMIHEQFGVSVDALGFDADGKIPSGRYYHFDLNRSQSRAQCRSDLPHYDVIVFAEVIEHLYTSPALVLRYLADHLNPDGIIVVQTPNAAALPRRLKLLLGKHPYELIREDCSNPGHFREYTARELCDYVTATGLSLEFSATKSYFDYRFAHHGLSISPLQCVAATIKNLVYPLLPESLRPGLTVVARKSHRNSKAA